MPHSPALVLILEAARRGVLLREQAEALHALGAEAVAFFALAMAEQVARLRSGSPATPSAMIPVHEKPATPRRKKRPGAQGGHEGSRRKSPGKIDAKVEHRLPVCPCCAGELQRCHRPRTRIIEDIPQDITPVVTQHTIHRDYCPKCRKHVEPVVVDAMPNATLGHNVIALSSWFHYGLGVTIGQVTDILSSHLNTRITPGGLLDGWQRLGVALMPWYEQIAESARVGAVLHADETGWRVNGQTYWLWCFCNHRCCYYLIDESRGSAALQKFFTDAYRGTLVTDFWSAYENVFANDYQKCIPHLLRELVKVDEHNHGLEWMRFSKSLRRLLQDGLRLRKRPDFTKEKYASRIALIHRRLCALADAHHVDADTTRLARRISKHRDQLFTFLDTAGVPPDNNHAERMIRPAVILRKNSLCNRSEQGATTQAVLMSVYRTLKLRKLDATKEITSALRTLLQTGTLPPLPPEAVDDVADG